MLEVIHAHDTFHHVINVHFYCAPDQVLEDLVNHTLEDGFGVLNLKGITL